jgi:hypothetical protein
VREVDRIVREYTFFDPITKTTKTAQKTFIKYAIVLDKLRPQCMTDAITLDFYATDAQLETLVHTTVKGWTMQNYLKAFIDGDGTTTKLEQLAIDLLNYGAAAQEYMDYKTDNLANKNYETQVDETKIENSVQNVTNVILSDKGVENQVKFTSATLLLEDKVTMRAKLTVAGGETYAQQLTAKVSIGDSVFTADLIGSGNTYYIYLNDIMPTQYNATVTFEVYDGTDVLVTLTYSVDSYVAKKYQGDSENAKLTKALWAVGNSAREYLNPEETNSEKEV